MGFIAGYDGNGMEWIQREIFYGISPTIWIQYKWEYNGFRFGTDNEFIEKM